MQQVINHNRAAGALPTQMPRLRQAKRLRLDEQTLERFLILVEIANAGPFAAGQAMPRQITGNHHKTSAQPPFDHMPIQPHVIVKPVDHKQRRHWRTLGPPHLADQIVTTGAVTPQLPLHGRGVMREVQPVKPLVGQPLAR